MNRNLFKIITTIIIIIILIIVVLLSINKILLASNLEYYNNKEKEMILASKEYFNNYKDYLPREINKSTRVVLSALVKEKYLDMIKDINNNDCNTTKSYVEVEKINNNEYLYKAHLVCDKSNYETKDGE